MCQYSLALTPIYKQQVLQALRTASNIIVYKNYMEEILSPYSEKITVTPSAADTVIFKAEARVPQKDICTVLMPSRTGDEGKGFHVLREAVNILKKKRSGFEVILPTYSSTEGEDAFIKYTRWHTQEELPELYAQADICVIPSFWREPFGITAVEAMASGKPVVASRTGGLVSAILFPN
jgi:glycosyltransferase involved in cell wall biosynthesis